ncbi:MAG: hypothetical protein RQ736_09915 [Thiogranum sp.]|nr:hypothetical protein [Thiogranum sp.]
MDTEASPDVKDSLWILVAGPVIWAGHFLLSYITAAVWCAKVAGPLGLLGAARIAIGIYTLVALIAIAVLMISIWRRHDLRSASASHGEDTAADRHQFLGFAAVLLAGLSFVATLYVGSVAGFIGSCG